MSHRAEHVRKMTEALGEPTRWCRYPKEDGGFATADWEYRTADDAARAVAVAAECERPHISFNVGYEQWTIVVFCALDDTPPETTEPETTEEVPR